MRFNQLFKEYFSFTKSERNGIIILIGVLVALLFVRYYFVDLFVVSAAKDDFSEFKSEVNRFYQKAKAGSKDQLSTKEIMPDTLFFFDPNQISNEQWSLLGVEDHTISIINNYLEKGGAFNTPDDLLKIYGFNKNLYEKLADYILINRKQKNHKTPEKQNASPGGIDTARLHYFDPNKISIEKWEYFGINEKTAKTIQNYLKSGGSFSQKEDLKKIYGLTIEEYLILEPYVEIESKSSNKKISYEEIKKNIEINSADTSSLKMLPGIGKVLAGRIIKFRDILGGYFKKEQLLEVYGLDKDTFSKIEKYLIVDSTLIKKINIQTAQFKELHKHPYLDYQETKAILQYREIMDGINSVSELLENQIISSDTYHKISPYLSIR